MMAHTSVTAVPVVATALVNGAFEEVFLLGFLARSLRGYGIALAIGISLLVRILYHSYQGPLGMLSVLLFGIVLSVYYMRTDDLF
jgi:membrane protease YdiL (CAAX protease family)